MKRDDDFTNTNYEAATANQVNERMEDLPEFTEAEDAGSNFVAVRELEQTVTVAYSKDDDDKNFDEATEAMSRLASKTESVVDELIKLSLQSESARVYEVLAQHVKLAADLHKDALEIMERKEKLRKLKGNEGGDTVIQNPQQINNYIMTTADVIKQITDAQKEKGDV